MNLLEILIAIPAAGFLVTLLMPRGQDQLVRMFTMAVSAARLPALARPRLGL